MDFKEFEKNKDLIGIYKITNLVNNKVYIGQSVEHFKRRFWHHRWLLMHNNHFSYDLQKDWNLYGDDNFLFEVIHMVSDPSECDDLEKLYISKYQATDSMHGYNKLSGGAFDSKEIKSFRDPKSYKKVGELNRHRLTGTKLPEETRKKMSEQRKGSNNSFAKLTEEKVLQIRKMYSQGYTYNQLAEKFNVTNKNISMIVRRVTWTNI